jgi:hypothetical protein
MENEPKPQKRGRKPKTIIPSSKEEPLIKNVIIEEPEKNTTHVLPCEEIPEPKSLVEITDEIPEPEPEPLADEIPEPELEDKDIHEFIEELNSEIENPKEEMKAVLEEIFEELKEIISTVEEQPVPLLLEIDNIEKREEVIEKVTETVIEQVKEIQKGTLEIKSLLNLLIIISVRPDMQEKYGLNQELVKILQLIIQTNSAFFFKIEESFKRILDDNKIDSNDVPELMTLFSSVYELLFSLKLKTSTIEISNVCGELIKLAFNIMLTEGLIIFETPDGNEESLKIFNALVDSSISLIKLSKTVKFNNKWCCWIC